MNRHITRYDKKFESFNGWRLCITRMGEKLVRYFSDLEYGGKSRAEQEVLAYRKKVYAMLEKNPNQAGAILRRLNEQQEKRGRNPRGILQSPARLIGGSDKVRHGLCVRISAQLDSLLKRSCSQLGVDASTYLRLAIYQSAISLAEQQPAQPRELLREHLAVLEARASAVGIPPFDALVSGASRKRE